jgi:hypothetical protein
VVRVERTEDYTLVACADGLGSGIKANLAATMALGRLSGLVRGGYSLREAFARLARTMNEAREPGLPYSAFSVARFLPSGETTILSYDAPEPVWASYHTASALRQNRFEYDGAEIGEAHCVLEPGEAILLVSDGITQAGLGGGLPMGWGIERVAQFARDHKRSGAPWEDLPEAIHRQARRLWGSKRGDDCTVCLGVCREGNMVTVFTGPPAVRAADDAAVSEFLSGDGAKVVCGATTAQIVARRIGKTLQVDQDSLDSIAPPFYTLDGIDLVTEGAVTLNQVYNILEEDDSRYEAKSGVSSLARLLKDADRVEFLVGRAPNLAGEDIAFRQQGILPRTTIVPLLAEKLQSAGKLVLVRYA